MKKNSFLLLALVGAPILFLFFTNPKVSDFKQSFQYYLPPRNDTSLHGFTDTHFIVRRDKNYFLFSHFIWGNLKVLGIADNYFIIGTIPGVHTVTSQNGQVIFDGFVPDSVAKSNEEFFKKPIK